MDEQQERKDHIAKAAKSRSLAQGRQAERTAEIAGKQAQLKREAEERREQKQQVTRAPPPRVCPTS
jgi:hypothetical protein